MSTIREIFRFIACGTVIAWLSACSDTTAGNDDANGSPDGQVPSTANTASTAAAGTDAIGGGVAAGGDSSAVTTVASGGQIGRSSESGVVGTGGATLTTERGTGPGKGLTLYYIRHGEVVANTVSADQVTYENSETFTELGLRQIDSLSAYLQGLGVTPDAVLVSPAKRTQKTIEPYLVANNVKGQVWMELMECCNQTPTGAALPTGPKYMPYFKASIEAQNLSFRDPAAVQMWQNDTYEEGLFMVMRARDMLLEQFSQSGKTIFVVGHASAGKIMIGLLRGNDLRNEPTTTGADAVYVLNTGVMRLVQDPVTNVFKLDGRNINNPVTK